MKMTLEQMEVAKKAIETTNQKPTICEDCGQVITATMSSFMTATGAVVCEDCIVNYALCADCDEYYPEDDLLDAYDYQNFPVYICKTCADHGYSRCEDCGGLFHDDQIYCMHDMYDDSHELCSDCLESNYYICTNCECIIPLDDVILHDGNAYCRDCAPSDKIHRYSYKPMANFLSAPSESSPAGYYGVELEVDDASSYTSQLDCVHELLNTYNKRTEDNFYLKEDGSLGETGFEIVTHPMTLQYHMTVFPWRAVCQTCQKYTYSSHNTDSCGLHVHASRTLFGEDDIEQNLNVAKCMVLMQYYWSSKIVPFSRRPGDYIYWAKRTDLCISPNDSIEKIYQKVEETKLSGRYQAINLENAETIEFRLFKGTLKASTIYATIQWVDTLIHFAVHTDLEDIFDTSWHDIFCGKYHNLDAYLKNRNLL